MKNILLSGDFRADSLGISYENAFKKKGYRVFRYDNSESYRKLSWPANNRLIHRAAINNFYLRNLWSRNFNNELINSVKNYSVDWVVIHNGAWIMPNTIRALRKLGVKTAVFHADNPFPPHPNNRPETLKVALEVDLYLTWSHGLVNQLRAYGVKNANFLPFGWDENIFPYGVAALEGAVG